MSGVLAILALTLQPVWFWKGVTQSTVRSSWPASAYPAQTMMLSAPSPVPILVSIAGPLLPPGAAEPHAAIPRDAHAALPQGGARRVIMLLPPIAFLATRG